MDSNQGRRLVMALVVLAVAAALGVFSLRKTAINSMYRGTERDTSTGFSFAGAAHLAHKTIASLHGAGSVTLDMVIVQGIAEVSGSLDAKGGSFGSLQVSGAATLFDTSVSGLTYVAGSLRAQKTTFAGIECAFNKIILSHCSAHFISMHAPKDFTEPLIIELVGTSVSGDITFKGAQGQVILQEGAAVTGKIINGAAIK